MLGGGIVARVLGRYLGDDSRPKIEGRPWEHSIGTVEGRLRVKWDIRTGREGRFLPDTGFGPTVLRLPSLLARTDPNPGGRWKNSPFVRLGGTLVTQTMSGEAATFAHAVIRPLEKIHRRMPLFREESSVASGIDISILRNFDVLVEGPSFSEGSQTPQFLTTGNSKAKDSESAKEILDTDDHSPGNVSHAGEAIRILSSASM
ncbi:hypothetical protein BT96DRAFT_997172 [Gymnopus androsaceus JB14]|uniref:Uncharacterized protein n=1 Tax=Gymnopus androsaceus JB14 TaxID=1447944 RepID=A0A6A4HDX2_9AGAR|nr:hypothetical protein BT96DRAFT_997172 [Gymnopus androsaceus JB14]